MQMVAARALHPNTANLLVGAAGGVGHRPCCALLLLLLLWAQQ